MAKTHKRMDNFIKQALLSYIFKQGPGLAEWKLMSALLFICLLTTSQLPAQSIQKQNDSVFQILAKHIDAKDVEKMYTLVNPGFKQAVSFELFKRSSVESLFPLGPFKYEFDGFQDNVNGYKLSGASKNIFMAIMVDKASEISTLFFKEYPDANVKNKNDSAFQLYLKNINAHDLNKMFAMLNANHQAKVPLDTLGSIYQRIVFPLGTLQSSFESYFGGISRYAVSSSTGTLTMMIGVDKVGKIETFFIIPKKE